MPYSAEILADTPSSYLRLNETSGTTAADSSGNNNVGTYVGSPTLGVTGLIYGDTDKAIQTAGNQQLTLPYSLPTNTFSIELWWKWTADGTSGSIWRDNTSSGSSGYFLGVHSGGTGVTVRIAGSTQTCTTADYRDGIRHHFVVTYDGATATLYIDGVQIDQWARTTATLPATPLHIGYNGTNANQYQPGIYDEVALYNYVLSPARVSAHHAAAGVGVANSQVEAVYVESLATGTPSTQVEAAFVETLTTGTPNAQVEAAFVEALTLVRPAQVEALYAEVASTNPTPPVNVSTNYLEIVLLSPTEKPFRGWGMPL